MSQTDRQTDRALHGKTGSNTGPVLWYCSDTDVIQANTMMKLSFDWAWFNVCTNTV